MKGLGQHIKNKLKKGVKSFFYRNFLLKNRCFGARFFKIQTIVCLSLGLGVSMPVFSESDFLEKKELTIVPTRAVEPLQVLVQSDGVDGLFAGEILSRRALQARVLQFTLLDDYKGVVWQDEITLPKQARRIMPFYFDALGREASLFLTVQAYDEFGNTVGSGHKNVQLKPQPVEVNITDSQVYLDATPALNFLVFAENGAVRQKYIPQIKIYQGLKHYGQLVETYEEPSLTLDPKQRTQLAFKKSFSDYEAGVYEIGVTLLDAGTRQALSATHYQPIYKPGAYFKVINLESFYTAEDGSSAQLDISGLSTVGLAEPVQMQVKLQHQQNIFLDQTFSLVLQPGYFTKSVELSLPAYVKQLNGEARFSIKGKTQQTLSFSAQPKATAVLPVEVKKPKPILQVPAPTLVPAPRWVFKEAQIFLVVAGCVLVLLILVLFNWVRSRFWLWLYLVLGSLGLNNLGQALTVGGDVFPMVEWSNPIPKSDLVFSPTSSEGFNFFPVKGRFFNYLSQKSLLKSDNLEHIRFNLLSPTGESFQFKLKPELLKSNTQPEINKRTGEYYFVLDLAKITAKSVINDSSNWRWEDGEWQLQLIFPYQVKNKSTLYLATPPEEFGSFVIDQTPPLWQWQRFFADGKIMAEADFTNQPIKIDIQCQDQGSGCLQNRYSFLAKGNFCSDATGCNTQAARNFSVCDKAGNCSTKEISVTGYDPIPPKVEQLLFGASTALQADEEITLSLRYLDPKKVEISEWKDLIDEDLCGEKNPSFASFANPILCQTRAQNCVYATAQNVWRGTAFNQECVPACPQGYEYLNGRCKTVCGNGEFNQNRLCLPFNLKTK